MKNKLHKIATSEEVANMKIFIEGTEYSLDSFKSKKKRAVARDQDFFLWMDWIVQLR
jgi:hypothetical protein